MSRRPDDLAAPPTTRPPHINRDWWYRATWAARQAAVDAHNRNNRPSDRTIDRDPLTEPQTLTTSELIDSAAELLIQGCTPHEIAERLDTTVGALEQRFRRRGLTDLARPFLKARKGARVHPCADCGKPVSERAVRCGRCAAAEVSSREEIRRSRSEHAQKFGIKKGARAA